MEQRNALLQKGRTQSLLTGFNFGGVAIGLLGGWLAQRQAALRELMAAGSLFNLYIGSSVLADDL